jgi:hypothetical protein
MNDTYADIDGLRKKWLLPNLRLVYKQLLSPKTVIPVLNTSETHKEDRNPMYTRTPLGKLGLDWGKEIRLRTDFWGKPISGRTFSQAYWTAHEYARFFLDMGEEYTMLRTPQPGATPANVIYVPGVQTWDRFLDWLEDVWNQTHGVEE